MQMRPVLTILLGTALSSTAFAGVATAAQTSNDPGEKVVCRKFSETGSLVRQVKICKTRKQWEMSRALLRQPTGVTGCAMQPCNIPGK